jgi:hypothetical protein
MILYYDIIIVNLFAVDRILYDSLLNDNMMKLMKLLRGRHTRMCYLRLMNLKQQIYIQQNQFLCY